MVKIGWGHSRLSKTPHGLFTWSKGLASSLVSLLSLIKLHLFIYWLHHMACGILVPQPEIEPAPPAVVACSLNHGTTKKVPGLFDKEAHSIHEGGAKGFTL